jgi:hypothetical protein
MIALPGQQPRLQLVGFVHDPFCIGLYALGKNIFFSLYLGGNKWSVTDSKSD